MKLLNPGVLDAPPTLDHNLFALNCLPLARYVDREAACLDAYKSVGQKQYEKFTPNTLRAAQALFASLRNRNRWAENRRDWSGGAGWTTHTRDAAGRCGDRTYPQKEMQLADILRALSRQDRYAVACFDGFVDTSELTYASCSPYNWPTNVSVLLVDVDMDDAWTQRDLAAVRHQVAIEMDVLSLLGLPCSWLKTGRRGHQLVIPLPCAAPRSAVSFLALALKRLLSELSVESATVDASNLDHAMRLAGGRHARTGDLALFFDPETCHLYDAEEQLAVLSRAYLPIPPTSPGSFHPAAFAEAMDEIADGCAFLFGVPPAMPLQCSESSVDWAIPALADRLDDNLLVNRINDVYLHFLGESLRDRAQCEIELDNTEEEEDPFLRDNSPPTSSDCIRRATEIWERGFLPGESWEWLTHGDGGRGNGVWAAYFLFPEEARDRLLEKSHAVGARSQADLTERDRTIRTLCDQHERRRGERIRVVRESARGEDPVKAETPPLIVPDQEEADLVETLLKEIVAARSIRETGRKMNLQTRMLTSLRKIISVLLVLLRDKDRVEISRRELHETILASFGEQDGSLTYKTVDNLLALIVAEEKECLVPIFCEMRPVVKGRARGSVRDERPRNFATVFLRGSHLIKCDQGAPAPCPGL